MGLARALEAVPVKRSVVVADGPVDHCVRDQRLEVSALGEHATRRFGIRRSVRIQQILRERLGDVDARVLVLVGLQRVDEFVGVTDRP